LLFFGCRRIRLQNVEIEEFRKRSRALFGVQEEYSLWFERLEAISFSGCMGKYWGCMR